MKNIKKIIINFPTNIGDAILALPALDKIKANFPQRKITAIVSPKIKDFFSKNNFIDKIVLFDKRWPVREKVRFCLNLRKRFDLMVDFKNSMLPVLLGIKKHTPLLRFIPKNLHIKDKHLKIIEKIAPKPSLKKSQFLLAEEKKKKWDFSRQEKYIFFGCFSRSQRKDYNKNNLKKLITILKNKYTCILLGLDKDQNKIRLEADKKIINLIGKTDMEDIYYLFSNFASLTVAVDSSLMHLSSYLNIPVVGLFGPTAPERSYPFSDKSVVLQKKELECVPCEGEVDCEETKCMDIDPELVIDKIKTIFGDVTSK